MNECMGNTVQLQGCQYQNYLTIIIFHVVSLGAADDLYRVLFETVFMQNISFRTTCKGQRLFQQYNTIMQLILLHKAQVHPSFLH